MGGVSSPWPPARHPASPRTVPAGGRTPAAAPGTLWSADGNEAPPPRETHPAHSTGLHTHTHGEGGGVKEERGSKGWWR